MLKKIVIIIVVVTVITFVIFSILVACVVYKHSGRPQYAGARKELLLKNKEALLQYGAERFTCMTHDNLMLSGFIIRRPQARRVIVLCHGYSRSKESMLPVVEMFPHDTLVLFDFRAHGDSAGSIISFSIRESSDIHAIIKHINAQHELQSLPLYGLGVSMGAASLVKATYEGAPFKGLVVDSSFADLSAQLERSWKYKTRLPQCLSRITFWIHEWLIGASFKQVSLVKMIPSVTIPVCFIHADQDWFVPVEDTHALYSAAQDQKRLWIVKSESHARNFTEAPQEYKRRVDEFFDSVRL